MATAQTISPILEKAEEYDNAACVTLDQAYMAYDADKLMKYTNDKSINPNNFTRARWRWIWSIEKVIYMNKISATMNIFFGGRYVTHSVCGVYSITHMLNSKAAGVVVRNADGKLEFGKKKTNPYLYGDRNKVEQFQECSNFRKLRFDGAAGMHIHLERDVEISRIRSKKAEKADCRRRISLHGTVKWANQGVNRKTIYDIGQKSAPAV